MSGEGRGGGGAGGGSPGAGTGRAVGRVRGREAQTAMSPQTVALGGKIFSENSLDSFKWVGQL